MSTLYTTCYSAWSTPKDRVCWGASTIIISQASQPFPDAKHFSAEHSLINMMVWCDGPEECVPWTHTISWEWSGSQTVYKYIYAYCPVAEESLRRHRRCDRSAEKNSPVRISGTLIFLTWFAKTIRYAHICATRALIASHIICWSLSQISLSWWWAFR